jgi:hypothetical protein
MIHILRHVKRRDRNIQHVVEVVKRDRDLFAVEDDPACDAAPTLELHTSAIGPPHRDLALVAEFDLLAVVLNGVEAVVERELETLELREEVRGPLQ